LDSVENGQQEIIGNPSVEFEVLWYAFLIAFQLPNRSFKQHLLGHVQRKISSNLQILVKHDSNCPSKNRHRVEVERDFHLYCCVMLEVQQLCLEA